MTITDWLLAANALVVGGYWVSLLRWIYTSRKETAELQKSLQRLDMLVARRGRDDDTKP